MVNKKQWKTRVKIVEITQKNYRILKDKDIKFFTFAYPGAMGRRGTVGLLSQDNTGFVNYIADYLENVDIHNLAKVFPAVKVYYEDYKGSYRKSFMDLGWVRYEMGMGNYLHVRSDINQAFVEARDSFYKYNNGLLFSHWYEFAFEILEKERGCDFKDKFRGCLIGGAIGDALGYPIEFQLNNEIVARYGENGLQHYTLDKGIARITDDTQMTLFTAEALILAKNHMGKSAGAYMPMAYKEWYWTQTRKYPLNPGPYITSLINVPELYVKRAPGLTCMDELENLQLGKTDTYTAHNDSKGSGTVMRAAPIGLCLMPNEAKQEEISKVDMIGVENAQITHGHELGIIAEVAMVHIVGMLLRTNMTIEEAVKDALQEMKLLFPQAKHLQEFLKIMRKAVFLAKSDASDKEAIAEIGEGWVAEETLAIAVYCSIRHTDNFINAVLAAVNHDGDSDTTGAVTGNIMGVFLGEKAIPKEYVKKLELADLILEKANALYAASQAW